MDIKNFGVGILAIATVAVASVFIRRRRRRAAPIPTGWDETVDDLYAAGL